MLRALIPSRSTFAILSRRLSAVAQDQTSQTTQVVVSKEAMLKLRKKSGYSFMNCRKALVKFGEDNIEEAEKWLKEMASKEGWAKAAKLSSRETGQGMCGILSEKNVAVVVEVNCETDYVAKNEVFQSLVADLTQSVMTEARRVAASEKPSTSTTRKISIHAQTLKTNTGHTVQELINTTILKLGENVTLAKAYALISAPDMVVVGNAHPKEKSGDVMMGRFVAVICMKRNQEQSQFPTETLANQLCQHIIGMKPDSLGKMATNQQACVAHKMENTGQRLEDASAQEQEDLNAFAEVQSVKIDEDESRLLNQSFMFNPCETVSEYLKSHGAEVTDFVRFEVGKEL
jgi:elongation factor Ts